MNSVKPHTASTSARPQRPPNPFRFLLVILATGVVVLSVQHGLPMCRQAIAISTVLDVGGRLRHIEPLGPEWLRKSAGETRMRFLDTVGYIDLGETETTDATLSFIPRIQNLEILNLDNTRITDAGLRKLRGITTLGGLYLKNTAVTDRGLEHFKGLTNLKYLSLRGTQITDEGVKSLKVLPSLQLLFLEETQVTSAAVNELKQVFPDLDVRGVPADDGNKLCKTK